MKITSRLIFDLDTDHVNVSNRTTPKKKNVSRVVELIGIVS